MASPQLDWSPEIPIVVLKSALAHRVSYLEKELGQEPIVIADARHRGFFDVITVSGWHYVHRHQKKLYLVAFRPSCTVIEALRRRHRTGSVFNPAPEEPTGFPCAYQTG
jgi:hypothetical protein